MQTPVMTKTRSRHSSQGNKNKNRSHNKMRKATSMQDSYIITPTTFGKRNISEPIKENEDDETPDPDRLPPI